MIWLWKCLFFSFTLAHQKLQSFKFEGSIWPKPQSIIQSEQFSSISPHVGISYADTSKKCEILDDVFNRYLKIIHSNAHSNKLKFSSKSIPQVETILVQVYNCENYPSDKMNEAYVIRVDKETVEITAEAEWGVIHALESLTQLIHNIDGYAGINGTNISDFPRFSYRGLLIDTSRHFLPLSIIKATISAMSWNKFNVLHWHIVDMESFPFQSAQFPFLSEFGSYSPNHVYSKLDIYDIIEFGRYRGVRIIPEFDTPGHTDSWGPGAQHGFLTECFDKKGSKTGYGPIDPTKPKNFEFMDALLHEVKNTFQDDYLHLGGDEVSFSCWKSNENISNFMKEHKIETYSQLESLWVQGMIDIAQKLNFKYLVWEEVFTNGVQLNEKTIVQVWKGRNDGSWKNTLKKVTEKNFQTILASPWYLNVIYYGVDWDRAYKNDPQDFDGTEEQKQLVIGGSAAMWGEYVDGTNILSRTWPRASAVGERLWSAKDVNDVETARPRLHEWRCKMMARGLPAEPAVVNPNLPNMRQFGYCPTPYDPFSATFLF